MEIRNWKLVNYFLFSNFFTRQSFASQNLGGQANFPGRLAWQGEGGEHFLLTNFYFQKPSNLEFYVNYYSCRFY